MRLLLLLPLFPLVLAAAASLHPRSADASNSVQHPASEVRCLPLQDKASLVDKMTPRGIYYHCDVLNDAGNHPSKRDDHDPNLSTSNRQGIIAVTITTGVLALLMIIIPLLLIPMDDKLRTAWVVFGVLYTLPGGIIAAVPVMKDNYGLGEGREVVVIGTLLVMWGVIFSALASLPNNTAGCLRPKPRAPTPQVVVATTQTSPERPRGREGNAHVDWRDLEAFNAVAEGEAQRRSGIIG